MILDCIGNRVHKRAAKVRITISGICEHSSLQKWSEEKPVFTMRLAHGTTRHHQDREGQLEGTLSLSRADQGTFCREKAPWETQLLSMKVLYELRLVWLFCSCTQPPFFQLMFCSPLAKGTTTILYFIIMNYVYLLS